MENPKLWKASQETPESLGFEERGRRRLEEGTEQHEETRGIKSTLERVRTKQAGLRAGQKLCTAGARAGTMVPGGGAGEREDSVTASDLQ